MARAVATIDLDSYTAQDWATVAEIARAGDVDPATVDLATPPVPVLAALIFVSRRKAGQRCTPAQATRWAMQIAEAR